MYRVSTLKKRPNLVNRINLGELNIEVRVDTREELLELLDLTRRVTVIVEKFLGEELAEFKEVFWMGSVYDGRLEVLPNIQPTKVRLNIATHTQSAAALERLSRDEQVAVRCAVAANPNTTEAVLERLSKDPHSLVRGQVAQYSQQPALLERLSRDVQRYVRRCVARNPRCPLALLERLSQDKDAVVRAAVVCRRDCPQELLERLSRDPNPGIRMSVAGHHRSPRELLERLKQDQDPLVSQVAQLRLEKRGRDRVRMLVNQFRKACQRSVYC